MDQTALTSRRPSWITWHLYALPRGNDDSGFQPTFSSLSENRLF
jgi:hypothetical protein